MKPSLNATGCAPNFLITPTLPASTITNAEGIINKRGSKINKNFVEFELLMLN